MFVPAEFGSAWALLHSNACGGMQLIQQQAQPHMTFLTNQKQVQ